MGKTDPALNVPDTPLEGAENPKRLLSLDVFRGFDIAAMLMVNMTWNANAMQGTKLDGLWRQLFHVGWNGGEQGATLTDLVFPWFLFIVGVAMPYSMVYGRGASKSRTSRIIIAFRRALVIYTLGLILDAASAGAFRFLKWNILQLIAGAYFLSVIATMLPRRLQYVLVGLILALKWYVLSVFVLPGQEGSVWRFEVDGVEVESRYAPGAIPVNGEQHFKSMMLAWREHLPGGMAWSPFLNWLTSVFNLLPAMCVVVMGSWAGWVLLHDRERKPRTGIILIGVGLGAWLVSWLWNLHHPWSKDFFTASYALLAAGTGTALLGWCYLFIDAKRTWSLPGPLEWITQKKVFFAKVLGVNAIALYFGNEFVFKAIGTKWSLPALDPDRPMLNAYNAKLASVFADGPGFGAAATDLVFALSWLAPWWLVCFGLYRKRWFIKV